MTTIKKNRMNTYKRSGENVLHHLPEQDKIRLPGLESAEANKASNTEVVSRLASIVNSSDDAIIGKTLEGTITSWNKAAERIYGYSSDFIIGHNISTLIPSDHLDELPEILGKIKRGDRVNHFETVRVAKNGKIINVSLSVSPIKSSDGEIIGASTIARDITERKRVEKKLRQSEIQNHSILESIDELIEWKKNERYSAQKQIQANLERLVYPVLDTLLEHLPPSKRCLLTLLESCLKDILSPMIRNLESKFHCLTPSELEICNMISRGYSTKSIASLKDISDLTVMDHRKSIRKKLGLTNSQVNLVSYLRSKEQSQTE